MLDAFLNCLRFLEGEGGAVPDKIYVQSVQCYSFVFLGFNHSCSNVFQCRMHNILYLAKCVDYECG